MEFKYTHRIKALFEEANDSEDPLALVDYYSGISAAVSLMLSRYPAPIAKILLGKIEMSSCVARDTEGSTPDDLEDYREGLDAIFKK